MPIEQYNEYGEIKKTKEPFKLTRERKLNAYELHMIHRTKDMFEGDCSLCRQDAENHIKTYWHD